MPLVDMGEDVGQWYKAKATIEEQSVGHFVIELADITDIESWSGAGVILHECMSEGGSMIRSMMTFRSEEQARKFYMSLIDDQEWLLSKLGGES